MIVPLNPPLVPRNGHTLEVNLPGRVSAPRPGKQNEEQSLGDQQDIQLRWLKQRTDLPFKVTVIAGSGSGECLERREYSRLLQMIESQEYDLVLTEDLGRIIRRIYAFIVCEHCEDHRTRLISINNNNVDTAQAGWRDAALFASYFYEKDNSDKSLRLKGRLRSRFLAGGALERPIFGYTDPPGGAKHDSERRKDPDAEPIYNEWFRRLEDGATYEELADWLNEMGAPTGPYCREPRWTGKMVRRLTHNPLLKGLRRRNIRKTRRVNSTGKYVSEKADPHELLTRECEHLAFFEPEYFDRVTRIAEANNSKFKPGKNGPDPRLGRPRKKTHWPGQHLYCGVCGRLLRYGGHGHNHHLLCSGAYAYRCWNAITVNGPKAAEKIAGAIMTEISILPDFEDELATRLEDEVQNMNEVQSRHVAEIDRELSRIHQRLEKAADAVIEHRDHPVLTKKLEAKIQDLELRHAELVRDRQQLQNIPQQKIGIPCMAEIRELAFDTFKDLAIESQEFSRLIRKLVSRIVVFPVRLIDGGHVVPSARFVLNLGPLVPQSDLLPNLNGVLRRHMVVDLFDPPQRVRFREQAMAEKNGHAPGVRPTERQIAQKLGITQSAVQYAVALDHKMRELGVTAAYEILEQPPADYTKLRRHKHPRFRFEPLPFVEFY